MIHELKTHPEYFKAVQEEKKTFEVRVNDRSFCVGDFLALNECALNGNHTGRCMLVRITYTLEDEDYCKQGYVILGIMPCQIIDRYDHFKEREPSKVVRGIPVYE